MGDIGPPESQERGRWGLLGPPMKFTTLSIQSALQASEGEGFVFSQCLKRLLHDHWVHPLLFHAAFASAKKA